MFLSYLVACSYPSCIFIYTIKYQICKIMTKGNLICIPFDDTGNKHLKNVLLTSK